MSFLQGVKGSGTLPLPDRNVQRCVGWLNRLRGPDSPRIRVLGRESPFDAGGGEAHRGPRDRASDRSTPESLPEDASVGWRMLRARPLSWRCLLQASPAQILPRPILVAAALAALSSAACGDGATEPAPTPNRAPLPNGSIPAQTVPVGRTATVNVAGYFTDPDRDALTYTAASSDVEIASVAVAGSVATVTGVAAGSATVTVTATDAGGLSAQQSFAVTVTVPNRTPEAVGKIEDLDIYVDSVAELDVAAYFTDPDGDDLAYEAASSDTTRVTVSVSGSVVAVTGVAVGSATVTVTATDAEGLSASASQTIRVTSEAPSPVIITNVEPAVLLEGAQATIRGTGWFSSVPANNAVLIDGLAANVTAASPTSLSVIVPYSDCRPPRQAELRVTVLDLSDARIVGVSPLSPEDLELPVRSYRYTYAGNGCLQLPGDASGGEYLIGVVSTSEAPSSLTPVTMTSIVGDPTVVADRPLVAASGPLRQPVVEAESSALTTAPGAAPVGTATPLGQENVGDERDWERHNQVMDRNRAIVRRLGPVAPSMARARQALALSVSDTLTLFAGFEATCSARDQVRTVVRRVGDNAVWLDDIENPSTTFTDSELAYLDSFYAANVREVHEDYFGGLSDIDGNNRVMILMTRQVNRQSDEDSFLRGWVWFADLYPSAECATSNQAEIFYGHVPDPDGVFGRVWTKQQVLASYPSLLTHEIAHLVQGAAAIFEEADHTTWEIEGGATLSEQLVAYGLFGHGSGRNLGYAAYRQGLDWYSKWGSGLASFFGEDSDDPTNSHGIPNAPEECSWLGRPEEGNDGPCTNAFRAVYDVPSVVLRYAMDRWGDDYSGGEQALMRRLTRSPTKGLASLAEVSDWPAEQVLADFYISLWIDLNGGDSYGMATWDLDDIWNRFAQSAQLRPYVSTSAELNGRWNVRAGSTSYLEWIPRGSRGPTALRVRLPSGAPVPGHISIWAFRVR